MKKTAALCLMLLALFALPLQAQEPATEPAAPAGEAPRASIAPSLVEAQPTFATGSGLPTSGLDFLWVLGVFALVMTLLLLTLKALGKMSRFKGAKGRGSVFTLRGIQPLDNRKYLAAVEVEGRLIVVGVTPDRICPVAHWFAEDSADQGLDFTRAGAEGLKLGADDDDELDLNIADLTREGNK